MFVSTCNVYVSIYTLSFYADIFLHTYMHAYIQTYTYTYIHIHTHIYIYIHTHIYTYNHIHTHTYTYTHTHMSHIYIYTHDDTCAYLSAIKPAPRYSSFGIPTWERARYASFPFFYLLDIFAHSKQGNEILTSLNIRKYTTHMIWPNRCFGKWKKENKILRERREIGPLFPLIYVKKRHTIISWTIPCFGKEWTYDPYFRSYKEKKHVFAVADVSGNRRRETRCLLFPTWNFKEQHILCLLLDASGNKRRKIRCLFSLIQVKENTYDLNYSMPPNMKEGK